MRFGTASVAWRAIQVPIGARCHGTPNTRRVIGWLGLAALVVATPVMVSHLPANNDVEVGASARRSGDPLTGHSILHFPQ